MTHPTDDPLREALEIAANRLAWCAVNFPTGTSEFYSASEWADEARAALAAAPQPAPVDRQALVDVIEQAWEQWKDLPEDALCEFVADALLARGLRLPGGNETMAWAVVEEGKPLNADWINADRRDAELFAGTRDRVVRVAIRVVEGSDDAA